MKDDAALLKAGNDIPQAVSRGERVFSRLQGAAPAGHTHGETKDARVRDHPGLRQSIGDFRDRIAPLDHHDPGRAVDRDRSRGGVEMVRVKPGGDTGDPQKRQEDSQNDRADAQETRDRRPPSCL